VKDNWLAFESVPR